MDERSRAILEVLIRDELAAAEIYAEAAPSFEGEPGRELARIGAQHRRAAETLRRRWDAGPAPSGSGAWGAWSRAAEAAATLLGRRAALEALREGERHVAREYRRALDDPGLDPELKSLISSELLPRTRLRLPYLEGL